MAGGAGDPSVAPPPASRLPSQIRLFLGLIVIAVLVLAGLALINSFFLEPPAPTGPPTNTQSAGGAQGGGGGITCKDVSQFLLWVFVGFSAATAALLGIAIARRDRHGNRIATSPWGIGATLGFFLAMLAFGTWRLTSVLCQANLNCQNTTNGTYSTFLTLLLLTLGSFGLGIGFAIRTRRNFFLTGWGIIAVVLYIPTLLAYELWYLVRLGCTQRLSCALKTQFLENLATIAWLGLGIAVIAFVAGYFVQRRTRINMIASGIGVLGLCALVLSGVAWYGHDTVSHLKIPGCDTFSPDENQTIKSCTQIRDGFQHRLDAAAWILGGIVVASTAVGLYLHRARWRPFFTSPWAIAAYVALALLVLVFLLLLLSGSMCPGNGNDNFGGNSNGSPGDGSSGRPGSGGGGGGGSGGGGGGGTGGSGSAPGTVPIQLGTLPLVWVLVIVGGIVAVALLLLLLKRRSLSDGGGTAIAARPDVDVRERGQLSGLLAQRDLSSAEAVIAAYRSFLSWCAARGLAKEPTETPREHARRVLDRFPGAEPALKRLVDAYEVARLSARVPTPEERAAALRSNEEMDELGVGGPR